MRVPRRLAREEVALHILCPFGRPLWLGSTRTRERTQQQVQGGGETLVTPSGVAIARFRLDNLSSE